jgi:hypothetical protein
VVTQPTRKKRPTRPGRAGASSRSKSVIDEGASPPRVVPPAEFNAVVAKAELSNIVLVASNMVLQRKEVGGDRKLAFNSGALQTFVFSGDIGAGTIAFEASVSVGEVKEFDLSATYVVSYEGLEGQSESAVRLFMKRVGVMACYPYFRAHVAQMSWAAQVHLPPLPVIRASRSVGDSVRPPASADDEG